MTDEVADRRRAREVERVRLARLDEFRAESAAFLAMSPEEQQRHTMRTECGLTDEQVEFIEGQQRRAAGPSLALIEVEGDDLLLLLRGQAPGPPPPRRISHRG